MNYELHAGEVSSGNDSSMYDFGYNTRESLYEYEAKNSIGNSKSLSTPFGPLHYMVASAGLSLMLFIIYVIYQQVKTSQHQPEALPEITTTCEHRFCERVQLSHPSCRCLVEMRAANTTLGISNNNLGISTNSLENRVITDYSPAYSLDMPPSYISSVHYDCPPSYEEAVTFVYQQNVHV